MMPGASRWNTVGSRCPPYGVTAWPAGTIRGPDVPALVDRPLQGHVEQVAAGLDHQTEVAHGGEARPAASCARSPRRAASGRRDRPARRASATADPSGPPGPPMSRLSSMSIRPGSSVTSPRSISLAESGSGAARIDGCDAVAVDHDHGRRADLAGVDVDPARGPQDDRLGHGTGSTDAVQASTRPSRGRAAASSTRPGTTP